MKRRLIAEKGMCREIQQSQNRCRRCRRAGLTVIHLLIALLVTVIAIFSVLFLVVNYLHHAVVLSRADRCAANLSCIGDALTQQEAERLMSGEQSTYYLFWAPGTAPGRAHLRHGDRGSERARDLRDEHERIPGTEAYPVSTNMYALIHVAGVDPVNFICPAARGDEADDEVRDYAGKRFWDFKSNRNVSYSFQAPVYHEGDGEWTNPFRHTRGAAPPEEMVIIADRNPIAEGPGDRDGQPDGRGVTCWSAFNDDGPTEASREAMSLNHGGDAVNGMRYGGSTITSFRADIGFEKDCIYTPGGTYGGQSDGSTWRDAPYRGDPVDLAGGKGYDCRDHRDRRDTFLIDTPENPANVGKD